MKPGTTLLCCLCFSVLFAQKKEQGFDVQFKPTKGSPRYFVTTEKKGEKWYREAYYLPERSMAMSGWYKDEKCTVEDGEVKWYHENKTLKSTTSYVDGKRQGLAVSYHNNGMMSDSSTYQDDHRIGIGLRWNDEGYLIDSTNFDGYGNGVMVEWYAKGPVRSTGQITNDTTKVGRWTFYHNNGKLWASEQYENGKRTQIECYDETGQKYPDCELIEASYSGGEMAWRKFLEKNLKADVAIKNNAPVGQYTVMIQFVVDKDGSVTDIKPLTKFGFGMEEEVIRLMNKAPKWQPAVMYGKKVKAYRRQPITFVVGGR